MRLGFKSGKDVITGVTPISTFRGTIGRVISSVVSGYVYPAAKLVGRMYADDRDPLVLRISRKSKKLPCNPSRFRV